ncbi:MAG TPA: cyclic-di-AMP receptor [Dehalococcoidia bacterium]|nr:cyclic-di-AMP receptor [Dehalococcoidia bacterium]
MPEDRLKLVVIIASDVDADRLVKQLVQRGHPATKIGGVGGFLRRGNATILSGVPSADVESVVGIVRAECHARSEYVPVQTLPFLGEGMVFADPVEVRVGGAILFVVDVERFEKT